MTAEANKVNTSFSKILKFSLPVALIGIFDLILIWIDFIWINVLNGDSDAIAAVRISGSLVLLIESVSTAVISSLLIYVSQNLGANKMDEARKAVKCVFSFTLYAGLILTALGQILLPFLVKIYGVNSSTTAYLQNYLTAFLWGYVFISLNNLLLVIPRYFQKLKVIYQGLVLTAVINIIATPLLILYFERRGLPFIYGAALGTVLANVCCSVFMLWKIFCKDYLAMGLSRLHMTWRLEYGLLLEKKGFIASQIFNGLTYNVSAFIYMLILSYYPSEAFNAYSIASYTFILFGILAQNFAGSLIPVVAAYIGGQQYKEIQDFVKKIFLILFGYGFGIAAIIMLGRNWISPALATEPSQVARIAEYLLFNSIPWALNLLSFIFIFVAAGSGDSKGSFRLTIINMYALVILGLLIIPHLFGNRTTGVFAAIGIVQAGAFVSSSLYYLSGRWKKASLVKQQEKVSLEA
ncbi:MATE family efflux transporter [Paenibacillus caui]|uniref:MATE family efflux transporter n=1 Tax=Paenibacillus caui TaxID=2873927 RepID=UPI001CA93803|nr:MATE family efflux transporter [Paenibacillus caui]